MLSCCLKHRKNTESKNPSVRAKNGRILLLSKCAVCDSKKLKFINEQEASELLTNLRIKTPLSKMSLVFCFKSIQQVNTRYKMKKMVNKFLLAGDKCMPEIHVRQPGLTCSACGPFTKNK